LGGSVQIKTTKTRGVRGASLGGALANPDRRAFGGPLALGDGAMRLFLAAFSIFSTWSAAAPK
jgi:hypothetical protein